MSYICLFVLNVGLFTIYC